jgi:endonuclease III
LKQKRPKVESAVYDEPVDALIYAIVSENMTETTAQSTIKRFNEYFIDHNDLRVSRAEEIVEILGVDTPVTRDIALNLTKVLAAVFQKYHNVSLDVLKKMGKKPARQILEKLGGASPFVVSYCMLTALQGHAIPLAGNMISYLRNNQMVHPDADEQQIRSFLARQISASNAFEFYALLRHESETRRALRKKRTTRKKKATAKTAKKRKTKTKKRKK